MEGQSVNRESSIVPRVVADGAFLWALVAVTIPQLVFLEIEISRTRELFTVYLLVGCAFVGLWWRRPSPLIAAIVWGLGAMSLLGLSSWTREANWMQGINYWSEWLLMSAGLMFGVAFAAARWVAWRRIVIYYACLLAVVQAVVLVASLWRGVEAGPGPAFYTMRPLSAGLAALLVVAMVFALFDNRLRGQTVIVSGLGISVVLAQHRSAWSALFAAIALAVVAMWRHPARRSAAGGLAVVVGFLLTAMLLPLFTKFTLLPGSGTADSRALPESATSTITTQWRLEMWQSRMSAERSWSEWLFGGAFGLTPAKGPTSQVMNPYISAHNLAVDVITMLGAIGLIAIVTLILAACLATPDRLSGLPIAIWSLTVFGLFYNWPAWAWLILGAALTVRPGRAASSPQDAPVASAAVR
jgi:hypothetical protein